MSVLDSFLLKFNDAILNPLITLLFAIAVVYFSWGIFEFIRDSDSGEAREKGKSHMVYGIVGMFIMIAVFGIMRLITNTLGLDDSVLPR